MRYLRCSYKRLMLGLVFCASLFAQADPAGVIKTVSGSVSIQHDGQTMQAEPGSALLASDTVITGADSSVGITLLDNTLLSAGANSVLQLDKFVFDKKTQEGELQASLQSGSLSVISGILAKTSTEKVVFKTPKMTLGVRGTRFIIQAAESGE